MPFKILPTDTPYMILRKRIAERIAVATANQTATVGDVWLTAEDEGVLLLANWHEVGDAGMEAIRNGTHQAFFSKILGHTVKWNRNAFGVK